MIYTTFSSPDITGIKEALKHWTVKVRKDWRELRLVWEASVL